MIRSPKSPGFPLLKSHFDQKFMHLKNMCPLLFAAADLAVSSEQQQDTLLQKGPHGAIDVHALNGIQQMDCLFHMMPGLIAENHLNSHHLA